MLYLSPSQAFIWLSIGIAAGCVAILMMKDDSAPQGSRKTQQFFKKNPEIGKYKSVQGMSNESFGFVNLFSHENLGITFVRKQNLHA